MMIKNWRRNKNNSVEVSGHRLEVSVYNVYITNQFQTTFAQRGEGGKIC
jgi:hypothetical protein